MATDPDLLQAEVRELRLAVVGLVEVIDEKVDAKVQTEVADKSIGREEYARRVKASGIRTVAALAVLLVLLVGVVTWNRVTLAQAQDNAIGDFRRLVETCRTTGPPLSADDLAYCESRVPGFEAARQRVIETQATARRNQERLERLEAEVAKLTE